MSGEVGFGFYVEVYSLALKDVYNILLSENLIGQLSIIAESIIKM